jgi:hypothetical protein
MPISVNCEVLGMENFGMFMAVWYLLWLFGIFCGHLAYLSQFWFCCVKKNLEGSEPGIL